MADIKLAVFDVAGTTAKDDGLVLKAAQSALLHMGITSSSSDFQAASDYVNITMGQRKIDVFKYIFDGESAKAEKAHDEFIRSYISMVGNGELEEFNGISKFFERLRELQIGISITTGFPREILDPIIRELDWTNLIDVSVAASEVKEGRPAPDMILKSIETYEQIKGIPVSPAEVAVIGDTISDVQSGVRAGAKFVIGVTSGAQHPDNLFDFGATHVLPYATDLLTVVN